MNRARPINASNWGPRRYNANRLNAMCINCTWVNTLVMTCQ